MSRITIITITIPLIIILGTFFTWPQYQSVRGLGIEIREKNQELQSKEEYFSKVKDVSKQLEEYQEEVLKIDSSLPSDPSLPSLFNFLDKTAAESGMILVQVGGFSISPSRTKNGLKEILADISVSGDYESFKNFTTALENTSRIIELENINFAYSEKEPLLFRLKIKAYSY